MGQWPRPQNAGEALGTSRWNQTKCWPHLSGYFDATGSLPLSCLEPSPRRQLSGFSMGGIRVRLHRISAVSSPYFACLRKCEAHAFTQVLDCPGFMMAFIPVLLMLAVDQFLLPAQDCKAGPERSPSGQVPLSRTPFDLEALCGANHRNSGFCHSTKTSRQYCAVQQRYGCKCVAHSALHSRASKQGGSMRKMSDTIARLAALRARQCVLTCPMSFPLGAFQP